MTLRSFMTPLAPSAALFAVCSSSAAQGIPCSYEIAHVIQAPPCGGQPQPTSALAISPNGRYVCGYYCACICINYRSFVYDTQTGVFTTLPLPAGMTTSMANDVSDAGVVVGFVGGTLVEQGYVYSVHTGTYTFLPSGVPQGVCKATGINASGTVCGYRGIGGPPDYPTSAFIWSEKEGFADLGLLDGMSTGASDIAEDGMVAIGVGAGLAAYIWDGGQRTTRIGLPAGADSISAHGIGDGEHVVGTSLYLSGPLTWAVPLEFRDGVLEPLPVLAEPNTSCTALAVASTGLIVGGCRPLINDNWRPCVWLGGQIRDIEPIIIPAPGLSIDAAAAVGDQGTIVCGGRSGASVVSLVLQPVQGKPGDTNCDRTVNIDDLLTIIQWWGPGPAFADINGDRIVDLLDLLIVIDNWSS